MCVCVCVCVKDRDKLNPDQHRYILRVMRTETLI